jgi:hypothetical protein
MGFFPLLTRSYPSPALRCVTLQLAIRPFDKTTPLLHMTAGARQYKLVMSFKDSRDENLCVYYMFF